MALLSNEQNAFISYLTSLARADDRGALAVLRRGLSGNPADDLNLCRFVSPRLPDEDRAAGCEPIYYLTAALFALHPSENQQGNLGAHLKQAAGQRNDSDAAERRFTALLNTRRDDLDKPLRRAVMMLKQQEIPVNWRQLFSDLLLWDHPKKLTQRAWANSFWSYERPIDTSTAGQPGQTEETFPEENQ
ncbi:MAG TPA: type I-E CRISPR-associated protein Cse2/CasB [Anaerolineaceae bacterium]|nr:type I-E CRISPR-associated protein Cse2/CasB [Anaerolineaceae bacterium]